MPSAGRVQGDRRGPAAGVGAGAEAGQAAPAERCGARNGGGGGARSRPGPAEEQRRALSVGSLGNGRKPSGSGGGRMLSPERLSLPGPEYLGEERGGAAGQPGALPSPPGGAASP